MGAAMMFVYNDGGRAAAGFKGTAGDCVVRAIAIASELPYQQVYDEMNAMIRAAEAKMRSNCKIKGKSSARGGVHKPLTRKWFKDHGWTWTPTMGIGTGTRVHLRSSELPMGRLVVKCSGHLVAVIHGVVHDTYDPTREGNRCVYGYWSQP